MSTGYHLDNIWMLLNVENVKIILAVASTKFGSSLLHFCKFFILLFAQLYLFRRPFNHSSLYLNKKYISNLYISFSKKFLIKPRRFRVKICFCLDKKNNHNSKTFLRIPWNLKCVSIDSIL